MKVSLEGGLSYVPAMTAIMIGYARCSTDRQDLAAQRVALERLGVLPERIYTDHGLTGTNRARTQNLWRRAADGLTPGRCETDQGAAE
jgi:hypothetical protein